MTTPEDPYAAPDPGRPNPPTDPVQPVQPTPPAQPAQPPYGAPGQPAPGYAPGYGPAPGYGAPTYGQPTYGQPTNPATGPHGGYQYGTGAPSPSGPPGAPQYPVGYPPPPPGRTNGLAIAALICSAAGLITCLTAPIGIVLGAVALSQIKRTREAGRGLALAGIWIGSAIVVLYVLLFAVLIAIAVNVEGDLDERCQSGEYTGQEYQDLCVDGPFGSSDDDFTTTAYSTTSFSTVSLAAAARG